MIKKISNRPNSSRVANVPIRKDRPLERKTPLSGKARRGKCLPISPARRMICDVLHFSRKIPSQVIARQGNLRRLADLREKSATKISWSLLFMKAYGILSSRHPELRQVFMRWPWPHFYEHPGTVGRMAVSRTHDGQDRVFFARFAEPESYSLLELQQQLELRKHSPIQTLRNFRLQAKISRLPFVVRRPLWWLALNLSARIRTFFCGTFSLTTVSGRGATSIHPPTLGTTTITYGPIAKDGKTRLAIVYDHRVMDGVAVADYLAELEEILNGPIANELKTLIDFANTSPPKRSNCQSCCKCIAD